jgi:polyphosphate kinase 2 (PPK2 family)
VFNRSYYEEIVVVRVHPEFLAHQKVPPSLLKKKNLWKERARDIRHFEDYLSRNGTLVRKFFLHVSKKEQEKRFRERLDKPDKNWKFSAADLGEREHWNDYQEAYEDMIRWTATPEAPWYVVPADNKWFTRVVVAAAIVDALAGLKLEYPRISETQAHEIEEAKKVLGAGTSRK